MRGLIRTLLLSVILVGLVLASFWQFSRTQMARRVAELERINAETMARLEEKEAMLERLSRERRLAHLMIRDQSLDEDGNILDTTFDFIELDDDGAEIARQHFTIPGSVLFVDTWTVKFDRDDVATGNPLRGKTLVMLKRIYSDQTPPIEGLPIDTPGAIPAGYATSDVAKFEQQVWKNFWAIATNPAVAEDMGVRVAQGEVVYKPVRAGQIYEFSVDAVGGINLIPMTENRTVAQPANE